MRWLLRLRMASVRFGTSHVVGAGTVVEASGRVLLRQILCGSFLLFWPSPVCCRDPPGRDPCPCEKKDSSHGDHRLSDCVPRLLVARMGRRVRRAVEAGVVAGVEVDVAGLVVAGPMRSRPRRAGNPPRRARSCPGRRCRLRPASIWHGVDDRAHIGQELRREVDGAVVLHGHGGQAPEGFRSLLQGLRKSLL